MSSYRVSVSERTTPAVKDATDTSVHNMLFAVKYSYRKEYQYGDKLMQNAKTNTIFFLSCWI